MMLAVGLILKTTPALVGPRQLSSDGLPGVFLRRPASLRSASDRAAGRSALRRGLRWHRARLMHARSFRGDNHRRADSRLSFQRPILLPSSIARTWVADRTRRTPPAAGTNVSSARPPVSEVSNARSHSRGRGGAAALSCFPVASQACRGGDRPALRLFCSNQPSRWCSHRAEHTRELGGERLVRTSSISLVGVGRASAGTVRRGCCNVGPPAFEIEMASAARGADGFRGNSGF